MSSSTLSFIFFYINARDPNTSKLLTLLSEYEAITPICIDTEKKKQHLFSNEKHISIRTNDLPCFLVTRGNSTPRVISARDYQNVFELYNELIPSRFKNSSLITDSESNNKDIINVTRKRGG